MIKWRRFPSIYEINTWVWLDELGGLYGGTVTLADVPEKIWDELADYGFDAVWLMGVWERSPAGRLIAAQDKGLTEAYGQALPDWRPEDVVGSPYSVKCYEVSARLGGREGLAAARRALAVRGIKLLLDFVPNHVAVDHAWTTEHPEYFLGGTAQDLQAYPEGFFEAGGHILAHGRDPYFPPWTDTAQLNAFHPDLRQATVLTLKEIARQCDGVRCDMAMLLVNSVFARTWDGRAGAPPAAEFWPGVIEAVKAEQEGFLFVAEAYWDMEGELQRQGFDFCYDKTFYDRLCHQGPQDIRLHLTAKLDYQSRLVRFIENHDEPRSVEVFGPGKVRVAATAAATLPGARLFHEGQFEGLSVKLPVQLGRRPFEDPDVELGVFYQKLVNETSAEVFQRGVWRLCEVRGWPDNQSFQNLLAWSWELGKERRLIVLNFSDRLCQGLIRLEWDLMGDRPLHLVDPLSGDAFLRGKGEMENPGLYVNMGPYGVSFFHLKD